MFAKICVFGIVLIGTMCNKGTCQSDDEILAKYKEAIGSVKSVSYEGRRRDMLGRNKIEGKVWLQRNSEDTLYGISFAVSRLDLHKRYIYKNHQGFQVDLSRKSYQLFTGKSNSLNSPGSMLVATELLFMEAGYDSISLSRNNDQFIIRLHYPYDRIHKTWNEEKWIYLNMKTYLPDSVIRSGNIYVSLKSKGRQVKYTYALRDVKVDDSMVETMIGLNYPKMYELEVPEFSPEHKFLKDENAPKFKLEDLDGNKVSLADYKGKLIMLDFWATWCKPCIASMPMVEKIFEKFKDKEIVVLGMLTDDKYDAAKKIIKENNIAYPTLIATKDIRDKYKEKAIPLYVIIDADGKVIYAKIGFNASMENFIKEQLDQ